MLQLRALIIKEFLVLLKDPRARIVLIVPPLLQLFVFGYAQTFEVRHVPTIVLNEDRGTQGRELLAGFEANPAFNIVAHLTSAAEIAPMIDRGAAVLAVRIGQRYSADVEAGLPAPVQIIIDGRRSNTALILEGYVNSIVSAQSAAITAGRGAANPPASLVPRAWFNENYESSWFVVPGLVAMLTLVITLVTTALSVAREREIGTFEQLMVTPLSPMQILIGKTVPPLCVGLAQGLAITGVGSFWFDVPFRGDPLLLFLSMLTFLLSAIGIGVMISSLVRTQQQAILGVFLFMVPAVMLSGYATPITSMPDWIQALTLVNPLRYFLVLTRGIFLRGIGFDLAWPQIWPMLVIGAATLVLSQWLFRAKLG